MFAAPPGAERPRPGCRLGRSTEVLCSFCHRTGPTHVSLPTPFSSASSRSVGVGVGGVREGPAAAPSVVRRSMARRLPPPRPPPPVCPSSPSLIICLGLLNFTLACCCCNNLLLLPRTKGAQRACCRLRIFIESTVTIFADQNQFVRSLARGASTLNLGRDMHANTKPTTAPGDDGAPASEESAQMKINNQLLLDYKTPVRTPHDRRAPWGPRAPGAVLT